MYKSVGNKNSVHRWVLLKSAENEFLKNFEKKPKSKSLPKEKSPGVCKENQIINPATGRCVLKTGPIGKKLLGVFKSPKSPGKKSESKTNPVDTLKKLKKEFNAISNKYAKYGLSDSETFSALESTVEGKTANHLYWGVYPEYQTNAKAHEGVHFLIKKANQIYEYINKHREAVKEYLSKTRNLRYD
jgi:hypothetical protein